MADDECVDELADTGVFLPLAITDEQANDSTFDELRRVISELTAALSAKEAEHQEILERLARSVAEKNRLEVRVTQLEASLIEPQAPGREMIVALDGDATLHDADIITLGDSLELKYQATPVPATG